jgi:LysM repeat protein
LKGEHNMSKDEINFDEIEENEGASPPKEESDRTFLLVAGMLGAIMIGALIFLAVYAMIIVPRRKAAESTQLAEIYLQNTQVVLAGQLTAEASIWTAIPTNAQALILETATPSGSGIRVEQAAPTATRSGVKLEQIKTLKPTAVPPTPVPTLEVSTYPVPDTYTLQTGEFPFCIARRFDIAPSALLSANNLSSTSPVYAGTVLTIPEDAPAYNLGARALRAHPTSYVVQSGNTVYSIACLFGDVDPRNIEAVNNLTGAYTLSVGQTIQIP